MPPPSDPGTPAPSWPGSSPSAPAPDWPRTCSPDWPTGRSPPRWRCRPPRPTGPRWRPPGSSATTGGRRDPPGVGHRAPAGARCRGQPRARAGGRGGDRSGGCSWSVPPPAWWPSCRASTRPARAAPWTLERRAGGSGDRVLDGATTGVVRDLALVVLSAAAVGGARWCVDTAAEHARTREQFGRPDRPVPGRQAPGGRPARRGRAGGGRRLGRGRRPRGRARRDGGRGDRPGQPGRAAGRRPRPRRLRRGGQGRHPGAGGDGLHLGARRPRPPATGHHPAPARRGDGTAPGRVRPPGAGRVAPATQRRAAARGRGPAGRARARSSPPIAAIEDPADQRRSLADSGLLAPHWPVPWGRDAGAVEQLVIDQVCAEAGLTPPLAVRGGLGPSHHHGPRHPGADRAVGGTDAPGRATSGASCSASPVPAPTWPR